MGIPYDAFTGAFLAKISEYDFLELPENDRTAVVDGFLRRAITAFRKNCLYDFNGTANDLTRQFDIEVPDDDLDEIIEIVSEGMVVQWMRPYLRRQELLENVLNTNDFTTYSPAELLLRVGNAYEKAQHDYTQMIREYSYNHGALTELHI